MIALLRIQHIPARKVLRFLYDSSESDQSTILCTPPSHAWVEYYCAPFGWIGCDPTLAHQGPRHFNIISTDLLFMYVSGTDKIPFHMGFNVYNAPPYVNYDHYWIGEITLVDSTDTPPNQEPEVDFFLVYTLFKAVSILGVQLVTLLWLRRKRK
jgi:hypothetical protein